MSLLQEFDRCKDFVGSVNYSAIQEYLKVHSDVFISDVYYEKSFWDHFVQWATDNNVPIELDDERNSDPDLPF